VLEQIGDNVDEMNDNIQAYIKSTIEYYKLDLYKKSMKGVVSATRTLLLSGVALLVLFFISFAVAVLIGEETGSPSIGFFIVGGFYLLVMLLIAIFGRKTLERIILTSTSKNIFND
tara:strand:+ start:201441 stop:201788 length:348 start_codon:yes stop_codon:yes gene_type:complete